jgi:uncharacterized FlaG/YvyC family protein
MGTVSLFSSDSLLNSTLNSTQTAQQAEQAAQQAQQSAQAAAEQDQVKLSAAAQAKLLYKQGESVGTIAQALGTTTKAIDDYLGITLEKELEQTLQATLSAKA